MRVARFLALIFLPLLARAQDPSFTQAYYNPVYLNPSFAGANEGLRTVFSSRNQWSRIPGRYNTSFFSADIAEPCYSVGLGVNAMVDNEGQNRLSTSKAGITGAWHRPIIRKKLDVSAGMSVNYVNKSIDWDGTVFSDQLDPVLGNVYASGVKQPQVLGRTFTDVDGGLMIRLLSDLSSRRQMLTSFGISAHHMNRPDEALIGSSRMPARFTVHLASMIPYGDRWKQKGTYIFPYVMYNWQDFGDNPLAQQREVQLGVYSFSNPVLFGISYHSGRLPIYIKNTNELGGMIGFQKPFTNSAFAWQIAYSFDFPLTSLSNSTFGSHEISLQLFFDGVSLFCRGRNVPEGASKCFSDKRSGFIPQL